MPGKLTRSMLASGDVVFLLCITWGGRAYRWSSRPCDPVDDAGTEYAFDGGLPEISFSRTFSLLSLSPDTRSISLELDFPVDVAELVERGFDLSAATGELSIWVEDTSYDDREILLVGRVIEPTYGADGEPVAMTIRQDPWDDRALVPDASAVVDDTTWPTHHSEATGLSYPLVFGTPGSYVTSAGTAKTTSGSPGLVVEYDSVGEVSTKILIAGHRVAATTVHVYDSEGAHGEDLAVTHEEDGLGRVCAVVDLTTASAEIQASTSHWVGWTEAALLDDDRDRPAITGACDLLIWMLRRSSVDIDRQRFEALRQALNTYEVSGFVDEAVSPYEWVADNLLPLLPISLVSTPDGVRPVLYDLDATSASAVDHLVAGETIHRIGPVTYERAPSDLINEIRLSYGLRARKGDYKRTVAVTSDPDLDAPDSFGSHYARVSASRYGVQAEAVETDIVYDDAVATTIASWWIRAKSLPIRRVEYEGGKELGWLEPGDLVTLTDDELHLDERLCIVETSTWVTEADVELALLLVEDPSRDG